MWPETTYDAVAAEANASAPARRTTASVQAEDYDGDQADRAIECNACAVQVVDLGCVHDGLCEDCAGPDGCDECALERAEATYDYERKVAQEAGFPWSA